MGADRLTAIRTELDVVRVVIVDDHPLVRDGLRTLLSRESDLEIVGEAESVSEAVRQAAFQEPDVVTMDVDLPDGSGINAVARVKAVSPATRILVLTAFGDAGTFEAARAAGADGFVLKRTRDFQLVAAIRRVAAGEGVFEDAPTARRQDDILARLTEREMSVLELIAEGMTNREIAESLFLAEKTIKNYVSNLLAKMGFKHRAGAAAHLVKVRAEQGRWSPGTTSGG